MMTKFFVGIDMKPLVLILMTILAMLSPYSSSADVLQAEPSDQVQPPGLPSVGKWMIDKDGNVSHWLGYKLLGKVIDEPINIILRISAASPEEAEQKLLRSTKAAGFEVRSGHSSGYQAYVAGSIIQEFPATMNHSFSDEWSLINNNHGRAFGPVLWDGKYYFTAALSREDARIFKKFLSYIERKYILLHPYDSFTRARDRFAEQMIRYGGAKEAGRVSLENVMVADSGETTGNHDGFAILLDIE